MVLHPNSLNETSSLSSIFKRRFKLLSSLASFISVLDVSSPLYCSLLVDLSGSVNFLFVGFNFDCGKVGLMIGLGISSVYGTNSKTGCWICLKKPRARTGVCLNCLVYKIQNKGIGLGSAVDHENKMIDECAACSIRRL